MKTKTVFVCSECGREESKWLGKCPDCNNWNTFLEEVRAPESSKTAKTSVAFFSNITHSHTSVKFLRDPIA